MSQRKPHSLLSFIYNTTIDPPYRLEMHTDLEVSFERFEVTPPTSQRACYEVEQSAYLLRSSSDDTRATGKVKPDVHAKGSKQMGGSTVDLFKKDLAAQLTNLINGSRNGSIVANPPSLSQALNPRQAPGQDAEAPWGAVKVVAGKVAPISGFHLLDYVYFFCHFPDARKAIIASPAVITAIPHLAQPSDVVAALQELDLQFDAKSRNPVKIGSAVDLICGELQQEYAQHGYLRCW